MQQIKKDVKVKIPDATTLIHKNEYNTEKENLGKLFIKNTSYEKFSDCYSF